MKTTTIAAAALALFMLGTANAQVAFADYKAYQKADLDRGEKNFEANLKSSNEGLLESSIALIGRIKLYFPERKMEGIEKEIYRLSNNGPTDRIRYKAYLIYTLFQKPTMFSAETKMEFRDSEEMFGALANRLQNLYLSANTSR